MQLYDFHSLPAGPVSFTLSLSGLGTSGSKDTPISTYGILGVPATLIETLPTNPLSATSSPALSLSYSFPYNV